MTDAAATVLSVAAPVFALILAGYVAAMRGWVDQAGFKGLTGFAFSFAAPALLFAGGTAGYAGGGGAALAFFGGTAVLYGATILLARRPLGLAGSGALALNVTFGNTVMMGIPLVAAAYGQRGLAVLLAILALHSLVLLGTATVVAEVARNPGARPAPLLRATLGGVVRNPVVMAVLAALIWSFFGLPVPAPARATLELLGAAAPPVSLFCLGGSLHGFDARGAAGRTAMTVVLKLGALPLLVWGFCRLLDLSPLETAVAVLTASLPTGANAFLLARRYSSGADESGAAVLVSTALSVGTLSLVLALFRPV
ncbi:AEC family transporter [Sabulicella glaciei]|uniref:AEC family transporter n=1 Tax=Sabulicella glaciei TaxID=2984948 RepID=A0ABT3NPK1_9PROT|nr:AEC family transporter [Roseococcus sp. MDT2-1-1]